MIVMDCSYAMAMVMPDEQRPQSLDRTLNARVLAPAIWPLEVANALRNGVRRGRLSESAASSVCAELDAYEVEVVAPGGGSIRRHYQASLRHDLTAYDAAYVELALERHAALATLDDHLASIAERAGLAVLS